MTAIAGIVDDGHVYIGADSAATGGTRQTVRRDAKVFRNGPVLIAVTGSARMGQVLQYVLSVPKRHSSTGIMLYLVTDFINAVRSAYKEAGCASKDKEEEGSLGSFLLGVEGHLFQIYSDYQIAEAVDGFYALGSGGDVALGALHATKGIEPRKRLRMALGAAERFDSAVRRPFKILKL